METKKSRVAFYDRMRFVAIVAIVFTGIADILVVNGAANGQPLTFTWHLANLVTCSTQFGVPLLVMMMGALLLTKEESGSLSEVLKTRVLFMAVPLAVWSVIYLVFRYLWQGMLGEQRTLVDMIRRILNVPAAEHLRCIYLFLAIYLLLPFLRLLVKHAPRSLMVYGVGLWLFYSSVWPTVSGVFPFLALPSFAATHVLDGYLGYFLLGWLLATSEWAPAPRWMMVGYGVTALVTTIVTAVLTREAGTSNLVCCQSFMPNIVLMTGFVFVACRDFDRVTVFTPWLLPLAQYALGLYFIHELFVLLLTPLVRVIPGIISLVLAPPLVWLLSLISVAFMRRVKLLRLLFMGEH